MLPGMDGYQVCRELRASSQVPIIMLSAKGEIFDKVLGLELGADDYLTKPFHLAELNARVKSLIRRRQAKGDVTVTLGNLLLYPDKRQTLAAEPQGVRPALLFCSQPRPGHQ